MKKYLFLTLFLFSIAIPVKAVTSTDLAKRTTCSKFELAIAKSDKSIQSVKCYDTYDEAKTAMKNDKSSDNLIILERRNNVTSVVDAKRALVYLGVHDSSVNTIYYSSATTQNGNTEIAYMNHHSNYGATDGVFLDINISKHTAKVFSYGITGWIKDGNYKIIPIEWLGKFSYYQVTSSELQHFYAGNIENTSYSQGSRTLDKKPSMLATGKYYSFDGKYFYTKLEDLVDDYKSNSRSKSVNASNPYYNYYMYLPHRTRTNYTSDDIDSYIKNNKGYIGTIYGKKSVSKYSNMYGIGGILKSNEDLYGANALMVMSLAINESAWGRSSIAIDKNNLFGHGAYDSSAYDSASGYLNPYRSIKQHAYGYINCGYAKPSDSRYAGSHFGNKKTGMNVKYASDPYWGEKAANYYYEFDKSNGFLDYNYYQLGVTTNTEPLNVRTAPNTSSLSIYTLKSDDIPVIILEEVSGTSVKGSSTWYKIVTDPSLVSKGNSIKSCSSDPYYNWSGYAYVHSSYIRKINTTTNGKYNSNNKVESTHTYNEYATNKDYTPKVGLITKDSTVYVNSNLTLSTGKTMKKSHLATVFMEALDENKKVVAYFVTYDYSKNQKGWVSASNLTISDKDILKVTLKGAGKYLNVYKEPGSSVLGSMYTDTYSVIVDKKTYNNDLWLKVYYDVNNTFAWVNTNISSSVGSLTYTTNKLNQKPTITASNKTVFLNQKFDPLSGVSAKDAEDGDLTSKIVIKENTVQTNKVGTYKVTYQVSDTKGETTTKTITVTVKDYTLGDNLYVFDGLTYVSGNTFEIKGFLGIKKMNNTNVTHKLVLTNIDTKQTYEYTLGSYSNYPYDVHDLEDDKNYNYKAGWFKGTVDFSKVIDGSYTISVIAYNNETGYYTEKNLSNLGYKNMARRIKADNNRGYSFDFDYNKLGTPIVMTVRNNGLISYDVPPTYDPMYNYFNQIKITNNTLSLRGTSLNAGVSYGLSDKIEREVIFEDKKTYKRYAYDLSYIDNGPYQVSLVSDKKDKTRAWYQKDVNLANLPKGEYIIYIKTTSNSKSYYGEVMDIAYTDFSKINTPKYELKRVNEKNLRIELTVK